MRTGTLSVPVLVKNQFQGSTSRQGKSLIISCYKFLISFFFFFLETYSRPSIYVFFFFFFLLKTV